MTARLARLSFGLLLLAAAASSAPSVAAAGFHRETTIAFTSSRIDPGNRFPVLLAGEIYLANPDGTNPRRLTDNKDGDAFATPSPDGKKIIFDSNRLRTEFEPLNTSDLFVMDADGSDQTWLVRGASPTWAPHGRRFAFHRSASGMGLPIVPFPGSATSDSDIFVANADDLLAGGGEIRNLTRDWTEPNGRRTRIADDPDWSPDGSKIAFTSHLVTDDPMNANSAEIYVMNANGTGTPRQLTGNREEEPEEEERGPAWSPDGTRIAYACRKSVRFDICVMDADGTNQVRLTTEGGLYPQWSPDGRQLMFHPAPTNQLFVINADGTCDGDGPCPKQITTPPGLNLIASWGELRVKD